MLSVGLCINKYMYLRACNVTISNDLQTLVNVSHWCMF